MTQLLSSLAGGKVAILLEGGYNLSSISHSMTMCLKALLGDPIPSPKIDSIKPGAITTIKRVVSHLENYWSALSFHVDLPEEEIFLPKEKELTAPIELMIERLDLGPSDQLLEASGVAEPKTLQEFLLLEENIQVFNSLFNYFSTYYVIICYYYLQAMSDGMLFTVVPEPWCPHITVNVQPSEGQSWGLDSVCSDCGDQSENWVCLACYQVS